MASASLFLITIYHRHFVSHRWNKKNIQNKRFLRTSNRSSDVDRRFGNLTLFTQKSRPSTCRFFDTREFSRVLMNSCSFIHSNENMHQAFFSHIFGSNSTARNLNRQTWKILRCFASSIFGDAYPANFTEHLARIDEWGDIKNIFIEQTYFISSCEISLLLLFVVTTK